MSSSPYRIVPKNISPSEEYNVTIRWEEWRSAEERNARMLATLWTIAAMRPDDAISAVRVARSLLQELKVELPP